MTALKLGTALAIGLAAVTAAEAASAAPARIVRATDAGAFTSGGRVWRTRAFSAFDGRIGAEWVNLHAFGLDAGDAAAHPEWRLKDSGGQPVYIGTRVAADVGNAAFRAWWIARAQAALATGYRGLFVDDVFMERRFTTAAGVSRAAIDPRTGFSMTEANWQAQLAGFMVAVRAALPGVEIVHDVLWHKGDSGNVLNELQAANFVSLDKGFNDSTLTTGSGTYAYATLLNWIQREQARGGGLIFDSSATGTTAAARLYGLASYLLINNGESAIANDPATAPGSFWASYDIDLGLATNARYDWSGLWRRDFTGGFVLVNEPSRPTATVTIPDGFQDLDGVARTSVTLGPGAGAVLVPIPPPVATPTPQPPTSVGVAPVATPVRTPASTGTKARVSNVGHHTAGAALPGSTRVRVSGSARRLSGRVNGAVAGQIRLTVQRRRGSRWVNARQVMATVKRSGSFYKDIPRLPHGTYRVRGTFLGTGTSLPARSGYNGFHA